jgi:2-methylcitrate dehydratase PrpD
MKTIAERLAEFSHGVSIDSIPSDVLDAAKLHLLDAYGGGLAASALGAGTEGRTIAPAISGNGGASVIGAAEVTTPASAALANGMMCHALDFDDTHSDSICHVSTVTGPAAAALAEGGRHSGADLLAAFVAGSEVTIRVGAAAAPGYMVRGFHPTSVCGIFGATATAAHLLGLDEDATASALGIAGSMASGIFAYLGDGSATKPIHAGWAAQGGVVAAQLAAAGAEGPPSIFEDRFGFFAAYYGADAQLMEQELETLGSVWEMPRVAFKPYPICHFSHSSIDAAASLLRDTPLSAADVRRVTVAIPDPGVPLVLEPLDDKRDPRTDYEAKFSLPFGIAALLVRGGVDIASFTSATIRDPAVLAVARLVEYERREFSTYPESFPGWVRIETNDGRVLERELAYQRGGPENPMTHDDVVTKYAANASLGLDAAGVAAFEQSVLRLEDFADAGECFAPLRHAQSPALDPAPSAA